MRYLLPVGLGLVFVGIILIIMSVSAEKSESKVAVGGVIGFIPFGFANDKKLLYFTMALTAAVFVVLIAAKALTR